MPISPLTGLYIDETYPRLVQTNDTGTEFADGLGRSISFGTIAPGGPINSLQYNKDGTNFTGSSNLLFSGNNTLILTGSLRITGSTTQTGNNTLIGNTVLSGSIGISGSSTIQGTTTMTGSLQITGSTTQVGNNTLLGNTLLSGSIIISGSHLANTPTIKIYGDVETDGAIKFLPVSYDIDPTISGSYIFVSGSTDDLYFSQNGAGFSNVTRLRWLEGNLYTGLLNGGIISQVNSNTYQISSGSGIVVTMNASYNSNPYPTIKYVNWDNLTQTINALSASYDQQFVSIQSNGTIFAQGIPYTDGDFNTKIPIGVVVHQNRSTINAVQTFPSVAYGWKQRSFDFIKAFGPLKISGYTLSPSGSSTRGLVLSGGIAWVDGRNYTVDPNNPSYIVEAVGIATSKIYRYRQSGSGWAYDTNGGAGYTDIDPTKYSNNGVLANVQSNHWTIQRVFYFPNSATKALYIYYGNADYANQSEALAAITTETFSEAPNTAANAIFIGYMLLRNDATFTVAASYNFQTAGLFRSSGVGGGSGGGGGATALSGLTDVQITSATEGDLLIYDTTLGKWKNSHTLSGSYTLSGSLITNDGVTVQTLTASFVSASSGITGSLYGTASWATNFVSASDYVLNSATSSFATTGSNTFIGNQTITGSIILPTLVEVTDVNVSFTIPSNPSGIYKVTAQGDPGTIDMGSIIFPSVVEGTSFTIIVTGNANDVIVSSPYPINARSQDVTLLGNQKIYNFYGIDGYWYAGSLSLP